MEVLLQSHPGGISTGIDTLRFRSTSLFLRITYQRLSLPADVSDTTTGITHSRSSWKPAISHTTFDPEWRQDITPFLTEKSQSEEYSKSGLKHTLHVIRLKDMSDKEYQWLYGLGGQIIMGIMTSGR